MRSPLAKGALIADEVGLGKTIEAGLVIRELKLRGLAKRILVVAPKGLTPQWQAEMQLHFGETFRIADQVIVLANGKIAAQGTPQQVRSSDDPLVHQFVHALPEGPVHFHYPGPSVAEDFSGGLQP